MKNLLKWFEELWEVLLFVAAIILTAIGFLFLERETIRIIGDLLIILFIALLVVFVFMRVLEHYGKGLKILRFFEMEKVRSMYIVVLYVTLALAIISTLFDQYLFF